MFLDLLDKPYVAYDIEPEDERVIKQDFLTLKMNYKPGICAIGNPPFGDRKNNLVNKFLKQLCSKVDYIAFILPIRQYKNTMSFYQYDLIYSEDLGISNYSDIPIHCCFNIYRKPKEELNKKPNYKLKDVVIEEHHRTNNPLLNSNYDYRICSFGSSIGKQVNAPNTYCKELCFNINSDKYKDKVIKLLKDTNFKEQFPSVSTPYIADWQLYKYIKEQIPEIS